MAIAIFPAGAMASYRGEAGPSAAKSSATGQASKKHRSAKTRCKARKGAKRGSLKCSKSKTKPKPKPAPMPPTTSTFSGQAHLTITSNSGGLVKGTFTSTVMVFGHSLTGGTASIRIDSSNHNADGTTTNNDTGLFTFSDPGAGRLCLHVVENWNASFSHSTGSWDTLGTDGGWLAKVQPSATFDNTQQPDGSYIINVTGTAKQLSSASSLPPACAALA